MPGKATESPRLRSISVLLSNVTPMGYRALRILWVCQDSLPCIINISAICVSKVRFDRRAGQITTVNHVIRSFSTHFGISNRRATALSLLPF